MPHIHARLSAEPRGTLCWYWSHNRREVVQMICVRGVQLTMADGRLAEVFTGLQCRASTATQLLPVHVNGRRMMAIQGRTHLRWVWVILVHTILNSKTSAILSKTLCALMNYFLNSSICIGLIVFMGYSLTCVNIFLCVQNKDIHTGLELLESE